MPAPNVVSALTCYAFTGPDVKRRRPAEAQSESRQRHGESAEGSRRRHRRRRSGGGHGGRREGAGVEQGAKVQFAGSADARRVSRAPRSFRRSAQEIQAGREDWRRRRRRTCCARSSARRCGVPVAHLRGRQSVSKRGQRGPLTARRARPARACAAAARPADDFEYDETSIAIAWQAAAGSRAHPRSGAEDAANEFASVDAGGLRRAVHRLQRLRGAAACGRRRGGRHDARHPHGRRDAADRRRRFRRAGKYIDKRMVWGAARCYAVRTVERFGDVSVESAEAPTKCVTPVDTFAPAAPRGLQSVATAGAVSLIWQANSDKDLAGYIVLRGPSPDTLRPITPAPIQETAYKDEVPPGSPLLLRRQGRRQSGQRQRAVQYRRSNRPGMI